MKKKKYLLITLTISLVIIVMLGLVSSVIEIGERLRNIHSYLEIAFYVLILIVVLIGIVYPIIKLFAEPVFSLNQLHDEKGHIKRKWCKKLVKNLTDNADLSPEEISQLKGYLSEGDNADDRLIEFFDRKISPEINKEIFRTSRRVLTLTAVSQNSLFDMLSMICLNFMMIKRITELCGFRPSNLQITKIFVRVLSGAVIAGALEQIDLGGLLGKVTESVLGSTLSKIVGVAVSSLLQGITNSIFTLRIGFVTKNYLLNADVSKTRSQIRKEAFKEAINSFPSILKEDIKDNVKKPVNKIKEMVAKVKARNSGFEEQDV